MFKDIKSTFKHQKNIKKVDVKNQARLILKVKRFDVTYTDYQPLNYLYFLTS
jgi:hypothetical protein